ncbi:MAG: sigma-54-dependent Fis family transcriptional regulator [Candidatus Marinimicrobia bacterium]|nr:sigma-54-dependent Fis family transcriptional regulator [Candidatus Neomarinimicrobiota bacterium]
MKRLLVVDDDYSIRTILEEHFNKNGYEARSVESAAHAIKALKTEKFDLVITDLMMNGMNGIELMEFVKKSDSEIGFLIITAYGTIKTAVEALHKGAFDFITKPFSLSHIESRVNRFFEYENLKAENKILKSRLSYNERFNKLAGKSKAIQQVFQQIDMVARSDAPVFIQGESGTGKELIAEAIHNNSERSEGPFIKVNCSAIPETLFESTLFGHEKGSFTNAIKTCKGFFEEANGGTFLLDEISEMPISMQAKLLRVLQEGKITRVGSVKEIPVDVRIIATTNRDIKKMIREEKFRSDLFFRLNVFPIKVAPLRHRKEDIPVLITYFIEKFREKYHFSKKEVDKKALETLMRRDWVGNVRQLENLVERAIIYSGKDEILTLEYFSIEQDLDSVDSNSFDKTLMSIAEMEKRLIFNTLKSTNNNRTQAASILDISVRTLRNKIHQYENEDK